MTSTLSACNLMRKSVDTDCSVNFPDLPGCTTAGVTIHEAYAFAHEALALHLEDMRESGDVVPPRSEALWPIPKTATLSQYWLLQIYTSAATPFEFASPRVH